MSQSHQTVLIAVQKAVGEESFLARDFESLLSRGNAVDLEFLLDEVDNSDYSLADWIEAFVEFDQWLDSKGETLRPLSGMLGYIHCCTFMNPTALSLPKLKVIVFKALTEFGFDVLSDAQI